MSRSEFYEQEELLLDAGSHEVARQFSDEQLEGASVPLVEQKIYLIRALGALSEINEADGFIKAANSKVHQPRLKQRFGRNLGEAVAGNHRKKQRYQQVARAAFHHAFGADSLTAAGFSDVEDLEVEAFQEFLGQYTGSQNAKAKDDYMQQLKGDIVGIQAGFVLRNRQQHETRREEVLHSRQPEDLNTDERIEAILHDPRAGFLPATNQEKNMVLSYLDYLDNPEFPLGVPNQLFEAMRHSQKVTSGKAYPKRTLESIIYELGDFYKDAKLQHKALLTLQENLTGVRPSLKLSEIDEVSAESLELATVTRYMDHVEALESGEIGGKTLHQLLKTHTNRWADGLEPGKHKTKQDRYTGEDIDPDKNRFFLERIEARYDQMTVKELYAILPHVITDQRLRGMFMRARLQEIAREFGSKRPLKALAIVAKEQLAVQS